MAHDSAVCCAGTNGEDKKMLSQIKGLHHVTSIASGARVNSDFFTRVLGLRRVKTTVNFDRPDVYHLYYGDRRGTPGTVMSYFPFPDRARGQRGPGEVSATSFSVPEGALRFWEARLAKLGVTGLARDSRMGAARLRFEGPDGDGFSLVETQDARAPWCVGDIPEAAAIRGLHSAELWLDPKESEAAEELLRFMGYDKTGSERDVTRYAVGGTDGAQVLDVRACPGKPAEQGAGGVHHIAFRVTDSAAQAQVRAALMDTGFQVTPVRDRDYFTAIYFRAPGGILFEVATDEPGFDRDEDMAHLGETLKLPRQHAHLRDQLEAVLEPLEA
jgi:glyoxalase family protein